MRRFALKCLLALATILGLAHWSTTDAQVVTPLARADQTENSLIELRDKRSAMLVVLRTGIVDASDNERTILEMVLRADPIPRGRFRWVYGAIAKKLNRYINKYGSMSAVNELAEADYVIFFNLLEYRRILESTYPFGELFVIVKGQPEMKTSPRVIWRSRKVLHSVDAIGDFIRELKQLRGEDWKEFPEDPQ